MVLGTADYLAPEQALDLHGVDARADVYSLGATLYALLAGKPPFHQGSVGQKLMAHQLKEPEPITNRRPEVPAKLALVVAKMLAKKPDDRFATAAEVAEALTPWAEPAPRPEIRAVRPTMIGMRPSSQGELAVPHAVGKLSTPNLMLETVTQARDDTGSVELEERDRERRVLQPKARRRGGESLGWRMAIFVCLVALMAGLAGGVFAFFLWGPRVP
jgi:serine/threonine protein kinase